MRKRASDLASDINQASGLLQRSNVSLTEKALSNQGRQTESHPLKVIPQKTFFQ
jgi:hypothetical protein